MTSSSKILRRVGFSIAVVGGVFLFVGEASAVTFGERDCIDNATNTGCRHPNTVSLASFTRLSGGVLGVLSRCSGSLVAENEDRFIILTAGHCARSWLMRLGAGLDADLGVSFDAEIFPDLVYRGPKEWSPRQYILGGQPVLPYAYGPVTWVAVNQFDHAVVVFDIPRQYRVTANKWGGPSSRHVDFSELEPVTLPEQDYLTDIINARDPIFVTTVGYGRGEGFNAPGDGGNAGGMEFGSIENVGIRMMTELTSAFAFMGIEQHLFQSSENPARGHAGSCFGDSGGPVFYVDQGVEIQIGINVSGEATCRAMGFNGRTDGARFLDFMSCVMAPNAEVDDILACGCTEVDEFGVCPAM